MRVLNKGRRRGHFVRAESSGASLLVAFYLLTSAATAYAECAWVLWEELP